MTDVNHEAVAREKIEAAARGKRKLEKLFEEAPWLAETRGTVGGTGSDPITWAELAALTAAASLERTERKGERAEHGLPSLEELAEAIHNGRYPANYPLERTPFADEDSNGREYCFRIARGVLAKLSPAPPVEREGQDGR